MPQHVTIKGNETANSLASITALAGGSAMNWTDMLNVIMYTDWTKCSGLELDPTFFGLVL